MSDSASFRVTGPLSSPDVTPSRAERERHATVLRHTALCRRAARRFLRAGLERADLEQVAAIGLLKAVDRFDPARGTPFEAFAWVAILSELLHHVRDHEHLVRLPRRLGDALPRFRRSLDRLMLRLEREPTDDEIACDLGTTLGAVRALRRAALAVPRAEAEHAGAAVDRCAAVAPLAWETRTDVDRALATLSPRERRVLLGSYLLGLTNVELGDRLDLSTRHVARLRRRALDRMQELCGLGIPA